MKYSFNILYLYMFLRVGQPHKRLEIYTTCLTKGFPNLRDNVNITPKPIVNLWLKRSLENFFLLMALYLLTRPREAHIPTGFLCRIFLFLFLFSS